MSSSRLIGTQKYCSDSSVHYCSLKIIHITEVYLGLAKIQVTIVPLSYCIGNIKYAGLRFERHTATKSNIHTRSCNIPSVQ